MEPPGDEGAESKSSGVLEETERGGGGAEGGVGSFVGEVFSELASDWPVRLPFRTRAWLRVQVDRYCVWLDRGAAEVAGSTALAGKHKSRYSWREDGQPSPSSGLFESSPPPPPVVQLDETIKIKNNNFY